MGKHKWYEGIWEIQHIRNGKVIWSEIKRNNLVDQGEKSMLDTYFRALNAPVVFYVRLANDTIQETDTLADIQNEPSGNGYSPQLLERSAVGFPILEADLGDWRVVSKTITFTASGGEIGPVNLAFLATSSDNTGLLLAYITTTVERTILDGDSVNVSMKVKLK